MTGRCGPHNHKLRPPHKHQQRRPAGTKWFLKEVAAEAMSEEGGLEVEFSEERAALVAQNRIIVRTVNIELEVDDVAESIEEIAEGAQADGGWVVSTDRSSKHIGFIAVRVPAAKLDDTLDWMRAVGVDVLSEASTSTDVTDEYYDLRSRVESLQATEEALIRLLDRAEDVEDALAVQQELARTAGGDRVAPGTDKAAGGDGGVFAGECDAASRSSGYEGGCRWR